MSKITTIFKQLQKTNDKAFIPFITAGDGGLDSTYDLMQVLVKNGADIIELGVPFSDPMADGPIIAKSHARALALDVSLNDVLALVRKFRKVNNSTAVVLMGYLNPIEIFGYQKFAKEASSSGVDGVLVIDMPAEEAHDLKICLDAVAVDFIFLVAPTTTKERLQLLATTASGFIYFIALKGVTGASHLDVGLVSDSIASIKKYVDLPIGVGFGIKNAYTAKALSAFTDAVIVGSSLVSLIEQYIHDKKKMLASIGSFANEISTAIRPSSV